MVKEKGELFSRKVKRREKDGDRERLAKVSREVNKTRRRLRGAHFSQRLERVMGMLGQLGRYWGRCWVVVGEKERGQRVVFLGRTGWG
jgi:hypothetical protein